jgi:hypothetical protein
LCAPMALNFNQSPRERDLLKQNRSCCLTILLVWGLEYYRL